MFLGTAASPGIAIGRALLVKNEQLVIPKNKIDSRLLENSQLEVARLKNAISKAKTDLEFVRDSAAQNIGKDKAEIFDAHILLLEDPEVLEQATEKILTEGINAEYAYSEVTASFVRTMEQMKNEYMRERASDIRDISSRVLRVLMGLEYVDLANLPEHTILVADDLTPSDTAVMNKNSVEGFVTDVGGRTSHTAIIARTLDIPAVVGMKNLTAKVSNGDLIVINGDTGEVFVNPEDKSISNLKQIQSEQRELKKSLEVFRGHPSKTKDGRRVELAGNIGTPRDIEVLLKGDAEGVGLYRTEFIYMDRTALPSEDEQFESYKSVLQAMGNKAVIIRTLDIGGDKSLPYLKLEKELNPFLGYRAIRICLDQKEVFRTQLKALLRASVFGNLKIMFPMISSLEELLLTKDFLKEVKAELTNDQIPVAENIQIGIMIEVPSAAFASDLLAQHVDFFSIGTNDLIQYMCAVDRMNEKIHHLYNPYNPAVLRMIKLVIDNAHKNNIWCGMCGEVAGDPGLVPLLLGMGLDELSMSPSSILSIRKLICSLTQTETQELWEKVSKFSLAEEIRLAVQTFIESRIQS